ncbi:MAG TPA: helix-turn-helix domain-containing protein [Rhizomicrobium sp.]|nr:helix-turn-helix domain-containing protein [Rhizomicrobium sp.]
MSSHAFDGARTRIVRRASDAFISHGFSDLTMSQLAGLCGLTRRALYHHFSSKEDVFRAAIRLNNVQAFEEADAAARTALGEGGDALEVIFRWLDIRFGNLRRKVAASPFARELNETAFRVAGDIMVEVSLDTSHRLAELIQELCGRGLLTLRPGVTVEKTARLIADAARGVNMARPPIPVSQIAQHYRDIAEALLFGCAVKAVSD